jgi:hypothetical protein
MKLGAKRGKCGNHSEDSCAAFGGHPHQSKIGSEEPIFDSFSLKGEALSRIQHYSFNYNSVR